MKTKDRIYEMLKASGEEFVSGEKMAETLQVTRAGIWKAIRALEKDGIGIEAVTNKGYRIKAFDNGTDPELIEELLKKKGLEVKVFYYDETDSTNLRAKELGSEYPGNLLVIAGKQTMGRGRKGRHFFSPGRTGIYMSFLLRNGESVKELSTLTANAAVATATAIDKEAFGGKDTVKIKWVNDLYLESRKVTGILAEGFADIEGNGEFYVVTGIGINLYEPAGGFPEDIKDKAGSVEGCKGKLSSDSRNRIIADTVANIVYYHDTPAESLKIYKDKSNLIGSRVLINTFSSSGEKENALVTGIDDECHLLVRYDDGRTEALSSGEVSVVKC
ncbi:MAG: biotin--[acetyl-CoA-carboxylase] ligase [Lachnospiraceae bacterium]|nr:biotin--[acetyl-CoA-carboxylase] ligase [Lachnospiraceae bacterium]